MADATTVTRPEPGTGHHGQTFLFGEHVYLRSIERGDERVAASWRGTVFPKAADVTKKWIEEELPKLGKSRIGMHVIVRKQDDRVVGSLTYRNSDVMASITPWIDPLFGDVGLEWLTEALILAVTWEVEERFCPSVRVEIAGNLPDVIARLQEAGMVETCRFREMREQNGERVDLVYLQRFSQGGIARLGDPMLAELDRSGTGEVRPVPKREQVLENPPAQAVAVGSRLYLTPEDKTAAATTIAAARKEEESFFDIGRHLFSEVQWQEFISGQAGEDHPGNLWFSVRLRENNEIIGSVGVLGLDMLNRSAETGSILFLKEHRGEGLGFEAKHLLLEFLFDTLGLHMVRSFVYFPNTRSAAALRKQGYREAGRTPWLYPYEGGFGSMVVFDLLADEWRALPRAGE